MSAPELPGGRNPLRGKSSPIEPFDPLDAGLRLAQALDQEGISYALGGALAYGLWGIPRATIDVDLNVFVREKGLVALFRCLSRLDVRFDEPAARTSIEKDGMFVGRLGPYRIDVFTPSVPFSWEAERTRVRRKVEGIDAWFLSAEALAVFKLLFFRAKDLVDLERLVAVLGERLDAAYVRRQIVAMMGEDDERTRRWDVLVASHLPPE